MREGHEVMSGEGCVGWDAKGWVGFRGFRGWGEIASGLRIMD